MIPLGIIAIIATFILITDSLDEGKASGDKKISKHSKKINNNNSVKCLM